MHDEQEILLRENKDRFVILPINYPAIWEKYGWTVYSDEDFTKKFSPEEQAQAKAYFRAVLARAKQFQAALDAAPTGRNPVPTYYIGAECRQTVDGMIIRRDAEKGVWRTEFNAVSFTTSTGRKITKEETEKVLLSPGDGVVPKRSLLALLLRLGNPKSLNTSVILNNAPDACVEHNRLTGNETVSKNLLSIVNGNGVPENTAAQVVK